MEIHVHSTLAFTKQREEKGKVFHPTIAQTNKHIIIALRKHLVKQLSWVRAGFNG